MVEDNTVMLCAIWYHLYILKNLKNTHGGVLLLVKLQNSACNFTKCNILCINQKTLAIL